MVLYVLILFTIGAAVRKLFVPPTNQIPITDARNPHDLLLLIESIQIYRLKNEPRKEEELYYLLIDILRNPVVFKAICGDSTRENEPSEADGGAGKLKAD